MDRTTDEVFFGAHVSNALVCKTVIFIRVPIATIYNIYDIHNATWRMSTVDVQTYRRCLYRYKAYFALRSCYRSNNTAIIYFRTNCRSDCKSIESLCMCAHYYASTLHRKWNRHKSTAAAPADISTSWWRLSTHIQNVYGVTAANAISCITTQNSWRRNRLHILLLSMASFRCSNHIIYICSQRAQSENAHVLLTKKVSTSHSGSVFDTSRVLRGTYSLRSALR